MIPVTVLLNDDLHNFVRQAVSEGLFDSMDDLVAHAIGLVRREAMLGRRHDPETVSFTSKTPTAVPVPVPVPVPMASAVVSEQTPVELRPIVDLTRQGFDSPAFMGDLVGKIERKSAEERAANKQSGIFPFNKPK
jgi:Arc/MetJ-type ribon-helix-helix transcriptional regulator